MTDCGQLEIVDNHEEVAVSRLLYQFECSEKFQDFVACLVNPTNEIELMFHDLRLQLTPKTAIGAFLDAWARLYGLRRDGKTDSDLQRYICATIYCARSNGTRDDIIKMLDIYIGEPGHTLMDEKPGYFRVRIDDTAPTDWTFSAACDLVDKCRAAGIHWHVIKLTPGVTPFKFSSTSSAVLSSPNGFSNGSFVKHCGQKERYPNNC